MDYVGRNVLISVKGREYKGLVLESSDKDVFLLKLSNGYNIGFNKKEVVVKEVYEGLENRNLEDSEKESFGNNPDKRLLL